VARLGYVVREFPKLSETFVIDELLGLDHHGVHPVIFARERPPEEVNNLRAEPLLSRVIWLSERSFPAKLRAAITQTLRHPVRAIACTIIAVRTKSRWPLLNLWYAFSLAELARAQGIELLHAHFATDATELAFFTRRLTGIPYGVTVHATEIYRNRFLCPKLHEAALRVTVCQYNIGQIAERCPDLAADDFYIKYAGVDGNHFRLPAPRPLRPGRHVIAVGRLVPKKGFDVLVRAIAKLSAEGRDIDCTIVGDGELEAELRALVEELDAGDRVHLIGARRPDEILELLVDADVLAAPCTIAPTGNRDSMPVVIKEAMAMELPVVASDDFGIPEMVTPDVGVLVPRDDADALADAIAHVLDLSPEERAAMGRAGRQHVLESFDEPKLAAALGARFEELLGR
jgi:glycosyltransferase involved in cell wall biosynthesis